MAVASQKVPSSSQPRRSTRKQPVSQSVEPAEAPTQVQRRSIQGKRKAVTPPTPPSTWKRTKPAVAKKSAGKNVPPPVEEEEEEEEQEEAGSEQDYANALATDAELDHAVKVLQRRGGDQPWVIDALQRHLENLRQNSGEEHGPEGTAEPTFVKHHKTYEKKRKKKVPWTETEEAFLVNLVAAHGAQWSNFERQYSRTKLFGRDQTAIKDKARNIMRKIIDQDGEEEFLERCPKWREVTVGSARRGVHGYPTGEIPIRKQKEYVDMLE